MQSSNGLCVDIDDTIADTALTIAQKVGERFGFPEQKTAMELMKTDDQPGNVQAWQTPLVSEFLKEVLNDPEVLLALPPIEGAVNALSEITTVVPLCCYISSRLEEHREVTQAWLKANGFPEGKLILRDHQEQRKDWKLYHLADTVPNSFGLIDNEKDICFSQVPYAGHRFWFDRNQTSTILSSSIISIRDWTQMQHWIAKTVLA